MVLGRSQRPAFIGGGFPAREQVREEAGELCQTLEENEGKERAASEAADLLYHAMVLLNAKVRRASCMLHAHGEMES